MRRPVPAKAPAVALALLGCIQLALVIGGPASAGGPSADDVLGAETLRQAGRALEDGSLISMVETGKASATRLQEAIGRCPGTAGSLADLVSACHAHEPGSAAADAKSRIPVVLANCAFEASGLPTFPCTPAMSLEECTKPMATAAASTYSAFAVYNSYKIHVDNVCYLLRAAEFDRAVRDSVQALFSAVGDARRETRAALDGLAEQAAGVEEKLQRSLEGTARVLELGSEAQEELLRLREGQQAAAAEARSGLAEAREAARALQRDVELSHAHLEQVGRQLREGHAWLASHLDAILGEVHGVESLLLYPAAALAALLATAIERTRRVRLLLFALLAVCAAAEHAWARRARRAGSPIPDVVAGVWAIRRAFAAGAAALVAAAAARYQSPTAAVLEQLAELNAKLDQLRARPEVEEPIPVTWNECLDDDDDDDGSEYLPSRASSAGSLPPIPEGSLLRPVPRYPLRRRPPRRTPNPLLAAESPAAFGLLVEFGLFRAIRSREQALGHVEEEAEEEEEEEEEGEGEGGRSGAPSRATTCTSAVSLASETFSCLGKEGT